VSVGCEQIRIAIIVEIEGRRSPCPTRTSHLRTEVGLLPSVAPGEVHSISECHPHSHRLHVRKLGSPQPHGLQAPCRGRRHPRHEEIQATIEVVVCEGCRHAEHVPVGAERIVGIGEVSTSIVVVQIDAGKVADDEKVEIGVIVEIDKGARVGSPPPLRFEPCGSSSEREISLSIVQEQIRGEAVVGVVVGGGHLATAIGRLVLGEPDVQVTIAIDVADSQ